MDKHYLKIKDKKIEIWVRYYDYNKIFIVYDRIRRRNERLGRKVMPNWFFYWSVWQVIVKRGFWLWKKPFRSRRHMAKQIGRDEFMDIIHFVGNTILEIPIKDKNEYKEDTKKKE